MQRETQIMDAESNSKHYTAKKRAIDLSKELGKTERLYN